jgi:D-serine deaminase-like pyridoxal phosphate-dependent protein
MSNDWFNVENVAEIPSPSLLVYPERVAENLRRVLAITGGPARLRPHIKTHKLGEIVRLHVDAGVTQCKAATIAEAELAAMNGMTDVLLSYQPVGPNVARLIELIRRFPQTTFRTIVDDAGALRALSFAAAQAGVKIPVLLDIDCGMHRTGVPAGDKAAALYRSVVNSPGLLADGLHAYDGQLHIEDLVERTKACEEGMAPVLALRAQLQAEGLPVPRLVAGGTPTFPIHARHPDRECSPGTYVFWDFGYGNRFKDIEMLLAAVLLTRVISKPGENRLCLDLGHKAVAAENPHPRVFFPQLPDANAISQSEEHLVLETPRAHEFAVGDCLYGVPRHICPTVALHGYVTVVEKGRASGKWLVRGRERMLTV